MIFQILKILQEYFHLIIIVIILILNFKLFCDNIKHGEEVYNYHSQNKKINWLFWCLLCYRLYIFKKCR